MPKTKLKEDQTGSKKKRKTAEEPEEIPDSMFEPLRFKPSQDEIASSPHTCNICHKVVLSSSALTHHLKRTHNVERKFECDGCDFVTTSYNMLDRHKDKEHRKSQVISDIKCPHCPQTFNRYHYLVRHMESVHKKSQSTLDLEKPMCFGCGKRFTKSMIEVHAVFEQKPVKIPCKVCKEETEVKLSCQMERVFHESGFSATCKSCTLKSQQQHQEEEEEEEEEEDEDEEVGDKSGDSEEKV